MHASLHCKLTVQVWTIKFGVEGFFDCENDRVAETRLAETHNAGQREPVAAVLLADLKYGFVYDFARVHSNSRGKIDSSTLLPMLTAA